jgi:hypothetical protein
LKTSLITGLEHSVEDLNNIGVYLNCFE